MADNSAAASKFISQSAQPLIVFLFSQTHRSRSESFGIFCRRKLPIVHEHQLIKNDMWNVLQLDHESRMHINSEAFLWISTFGRRIGKFPRLQNRGVKNHFARVTHGGSVFQNCQQLLPSYYRTVFLENLGALRRNM